MIKLYYDRHDYEPSYEPRNGGEEYIRIVSDKGPSTSSSVYYSVLKGENVIEQLQYLRFARTTVCVVSRERERERAKSEPRIVPLQCR